MEHIEIINKAARFKSGCTCFLLLCLFGCAVAPPKNPQDICEIFREKQEWYQDAYTAHERWQVPIPVLMAIIYQESRFNAEARPPRTTCLFIFPGPRPSSAYGYPQALDETWDKYKQFTDNHGADRDNFDDAIDFVGWYCHQSHARCGIRRNDAYNLYLAYHEGQEGFRRKTYQNKAWLKQTAKTVQTRAKTYIRQLNSCEEEFRETGGCCLWPF
ncbi:transglycosylase SLT domain-containing protein [Desulfococcaceae bacterium HSG8]|nr:transglycosylase SLT domain-containing protein [Desulfococcaceae bacterium HSG8]